MVLNTQKEFTTPFEEIYPQELNKMPSIYLSARKRDGRFVIARQNCNRWQQ